MLEQENQEELETQQKFEPVKINLQQYILALDHIENIFNHLSSCKKLPEKCKECPVIGALIELRANASFEQFKAIEKHLGFMGFSAEIFDLNRRNQETPLKAAEE